MRLTLMILLPLLTLLSPAHAEAPEIVGAKVTKSGMFWHIEVSVSHPDSGWDHYADEWDVLSMDGKVLATRSLMHPHVDEQPFTRSLSNVMLPDGTTEIEIRAHCSSGMFSETTYTVKVGG